MTIYIDDLKFTRAGVKNPRKKYAHMVADSVEEMMHFAEKILVKSHFLHKANILHFDIDKEQWLAAQNAGAQLVSSKEIVRRGRIMK